MRTKGSTAYINVSLGQLNNILKPNAQVAIKKSFATELGLFNPKNKVLPDTTEEKEDDVEFTVTDLNN